MTPAAPSAPRLLVVDDEPSIRDLLSASLRFAGYDVVTAADGSARLAYTEPETGYNGLAYEAAEVARRISAGETETPIRPMVDSIATLATMDEVRSQIGQHF